jgi:hypothetical protein
VSFLTTVGGGGVAQVKADFAKYPAVSSRSTFLLALCRK